MSSGADLQAILRAELKRFVDSDLEQRQERPAFSAVYAHWWEPGDKETADEADLGAIRNAKESLRRDLRLNNPTEMADRAAKLLQRHGLPPDMLRPLTYGLIEAAITGWEIAEQRTLGTAPLVMLPETALPVVSVIEAGPQSAPVPALPLASTLLAAFDEWGEASSGWGDGSSKQAATSLGLFLEIAGDLPIDRYGPQHGDQFRATMRRLPAHYRKSAKDKEKPLQAIIADAAPDTPTLSDKTVKRHFWALSRFFEFLKETGRLPRERANPLRGFTFNTKGPARSQRDMWAGDELQKLFASPVWVGCHKFFRSQQGDQIVRDALFWLPLLGLFHGNRLEEFAQLRREDVAQEHGIWYFNITDADGRQLKNQQSRRKVPLHSELIRVGFLQYVQSTAPTPSDPVFPDLKPGGTDKKLGFSFTKNFSAYRRAVGVYRKGLDYHSFRHGVTTKLYEAEVNEGWIDVLTGHESGGESRSRYLKGITLPSLRDAIEKVRWPEVDLSGLYIHVD